MQFIQNFLEGIQQENLNKDLQRVNSLYLAWDQMLYNSTSERELVDKLNTALNLVDGIRNGEHTTPTNGYNQAVNPSINKVVQVYYCKQSNKFKSI